MRWNGACTQDEAKLKVDKDERKQGPEVRKVEAQKDWADCLPVEEATL